jgi:hypothetical protein
MMPLNTPLAAQAHIQVFVFYACESACARELACPAVHKCLHRLVCALTLTRARFFSSSLVLPVLAGGSCTCRSGTHSHRLEVTNASSFFSYCRSVLPFRPRPILKVCLQTTFMLIISVLIFIPLCAGSIVHAMMDTFSSAQCAKTLGPSPFFRPSSLRPYLSSFLLPSSLSLLRSQSQVWSMQQSVCKLPSHARSLSQGPRCRSRCPSMCACV